MALVSCLVDTNVLLRVASRSGAEHPMVDKALAHLAEQGTILCYTLQNMAEFWNVMTRPKARNGFELSIVEAEREIRALESGMTLLPDNAAVYARWRKIIVRYGVSGVQVHDARLAAIMYVHGVNHILTLNVTDFSRFAGLTALHPQHATTLQ
jgi:predicted nucleic acid-binding protein